MRYYSWQSAPGRSARPVQIHGHWRIEAPRNRLNRSKFRLKLGRKAARGLGLGGCAAAIHSHSQERRDLFALGHALSLGGRGAFNSVERLSLVRETGDELFNCHNL